jgi:hypothetical protein
LVYRRVSVDRGFAGSSQERVINGQCDILLHITSVTHNLGESNGRLAGSPQGLTRIGRRAAGARKVGTVAACGLRRCDRRDAASGRDGEPITAFATVEVKFGR